MRAPINLPLSRTPQRGPRATPVEFNARSKELLAGVNPTLAELMIAVEAQHPDAFEITEGMRDRDRQVQLVAQGKSQTLNSRHLTGNAVDIAMIGPDGQPNWDFEAYRPIAETAKAAAAKLGVPDFVWGGDWKSLRDGVHFQIGGPAAAGGPPVPSVGMGGQPLSFGGAVPAAPTTMAGIAGMFGDPAAGLSMGMPDPFAAGMMAQQQQRQQRRKDEEEAEQTRRVALLSGVGQMFA